MSPFATLRVAYAASSIERIGWVSFRTNTLVRREGKLACSMRAVQVEPDFHVCHKLLLSRGYHSFPDPASHSLILLDIDVLRWASTFPLGLHAAAVDSRGLGAVCIGYEVRSYRYRWMSVWWCAIFSWQQVVLAVLQQ